MTADQRRKAQARARRLHAEGHSHREIAAAVRVGKTTITRWLADPAPESQPLANIQTDDGRPVAGAEEGNQRAMTHGAFSERLVEPRAAELVEAVVATAPFLAEATFAPAVRAWARVEASVTLLVEYLDRVGGLLDDDGEPRSAVNTLLKFERAAAEARSRLGLDPTSRAKLEREMADAARGRFDLEGLLTEGRAVLKARENGGDHEQA